MKKQHKEESAPRSDKQSSSSLGRYMEQVIRKAQLTEHKERGSKKWADRGWKHTEDCTCEKCTN